MLTSNVNRFTKVNATSSMLLKNSLAFGWLNIFELQYYIMYDRIHILVKKK